MEDNRDRSAICYGPLVLAGELGPEEDEIIRGQAYVPVFITEGKGITEWVKPVEGKPATFRTINVGTPRDVVLYPFYRMHNRRYSVYWDIYSEEQYEKLVEENKAEEDYLRKLDESTIDFIQPGELQSEQVHNMQGEKSEPGEGEDMKWREAYGGGWFSY